MKKFLIIALLISSVSAFAKCREEVVTAAINFRASQSPTNVDFVAEPQLLDSKRSFLNKNRTKFYYWVQVDVHADSAAEDVTPWIVKVIAQKDGEVCRILEVTR